MQEQIATFPVPNLHIVGFQKCGTSAMAHFLSQHPSVCMVSGKEAHVFDDPAYQSAGDKHAMAMGKYREKLTHYKGEAIILDATPVTIFHPKFIQACVAFNPHAKFIVMTREPIARAFSHYQMTKQRGLEPYSPFWAFVLEPSRMRGWRKRLPTCPFEHPYRDFSYLSRGRYQQQLDLLYALVKTEQVMVIEQAALASDHDNTLEKVFSFLNLPSVKVPQASIFAVNPSQKEERSFAAWLVAKLYFLLFS